ncbi:hypothetical protein [Streptomyces buecherae]|uniref:hypothetical protein n=1 Tax=Streptomyces buecherae TaxID=2763006 RepID=UPI0037A7EB6C
MPSDMPGWVSALCVAEWAMPKSMTRGHGVGPFGSASTTAAANVPLTCRAAATSRAKRRRNPASSASSARAVFTATVRPCAERPR